MPCWIYHQGNELWWNLLATKFCGDGSCLTGISAGGFSPDADKNLFAGTNAGALLMVRVVALIYSWVNVRVKVLLVEAVIPSLVFMLVVVGL